MSMTQVEGDCCGGQLSLMGDDERAGSRGNGDQRAQGNQFATRGADIDLFKGIG